MFIVFFSSPDLSSFEEFAPSLPLANPNTNCIGMYSIGDGS